MGGHIVLPKRTSFSKFFFLDIMYKKVRKSILNDSKLG